MNDEQRALVRDQFGANAANYATSAPHAKGASLERLVELIDPRADWIALDIATGAGHAALIMAPHVSRVIASDITSEMLEQTGRLAHERGIANLTCEAADAEALHYGDETFDLVTCRIAPHHFADPAAFVAETFRVLRPGGVFGLVDNVVPDDPAVAGFCDHFEKRRDPSHVRCLSMAEWSERITDVGYAVVSAETAGKRMNFANWADNMNVADDMRVELLSDLTSASAGATEFFRPELAGDDQTNTWFTLTEGLIVAKKPAA